MTITGAQLGRVGNVTTVTVVSDLGGSIYYHWYRDGCFVRCTQVPHHDFAIEAGDQARIECIDSNDANFDPIANAPDAYPARRTISWLRSLATDIDHYRVEQNRASGGWTLIRRVPHDPGVWQYRVLTPRLDDLTDYQWRIVPVDAAGNEGTAETVDAETIVRTPDAPDFTISFDPDTTRVTFAEA